MVSCFHSCPTRESLLFIQRPESSLKAHTRLPHLAQNPLITSSTYVIKSSISLQITIRDGSWLLRQQILSSFRSYLDYFVPIILVVLLTFICVHISVSECLHFLLFLLPRKLGPYTSTWIIFPLHLCLF